MDFIKTLDLNTFDFIQKYLSNTFLDRILPIITNLGQGGAIWIVISLALIISRKYRKAGLLTLAVLLINYLIGDVALKNIIERERPFISIEGIKLIVKPPSSFSFPSGHTSSAFAAATILSLHIKKYSFLFITLACIIGFSRIYLYVHYLSDVIAGMCLGIVVAMICNIIWENFLEKKFAKV
ncbi:phosphatase PAP2 family protein [Clostridium intestinale]|uniref:phosphatase PAP2 family protein n=1 Tax=Clostridium intestinale TaxID=36845 RepID=UPI0028E42288|nr:phosphatase PAP2 family protein [Clostridium intestinale]